MNKKLENTINLYMHGIRDGKAREAITTFTGEGNLVVALSKSFSGNTDYAVFNLFRIEHRKIAEHWDSIEEIAPKDQWANSGKF